MLEQIEFRTLNYQGEREVWEFFRTFWNLPEEHNEYFRPRSDPFVREWIAKAHVASERDATFAGVALHEGTLVGLHLLRRFEEEEQIGVHIAGLWVHPDFRRIGIGRELKTRGERWAREVGATFLNSNVHPGNAAMLELNQKAGFTVFRYNLRKRLPPQSDTA